MIKSDSPNFLVIMSDQHSPDAISALGHPAVKTPSLDQLASTGVAFTNAYCPYPMCTPSRAGFMTGQLTPQHGVWELGSPLRSDMPTWAHVLRNAGYLTSLCGRMHFVGCDKNHGFERRPYPEQSDMLVPYSYGDWDKPQDDDHVMLPAIKSAGPHENPADAERYDRSVIDAAIGELQELSSNGDGRPWALTVGLYLPHFPYVTDRTHFNLYENVDIPLPRPAPNGATYEDLVPEQFTNSRKWLGLSTDGVDAGQIRTARRCYYGMISSMDEMVGELITRLGELKEAQNTWILYVSDHGDNLGEHGFWSKLNFYEESVRVPCILVPPGGMESGAVCRAPISLVDWMPTVLDICGQEDHLEPLPGRSLIPLMQNPKRTKDDRSIISDYACDGTRVPMRMVRRGRWKASFAPGFSPVVFDLKNDPFEWNNLDGDPSVRDVLEELSQIARADGWDPDVLQREISTHKRRLSYIHNAETRHLADPI